MSARNLLALFVVASCVAACGTYVPEIQENPFASEKERSDFIQAIVRNVRCEIQDAVIHLYDDNRDIDPYNRNLKWFDKWAIQMSLQLTIDEKGILNPTGNWLPPSPANSIFNLAVGGTVSTEAQRINKIGAFFLVADLKKLGPCPPQYRNRGPFILQSDLKLYQWLHAMMISINNNDTPAPADSSGPLQSNVLSHEVKFDIVSTGTLNPGWVLTQGTINQNGPLLSATRDRTQDLIITLGPADPKWAQFVIDPVTGRGRLGPGFGPAASNAALASEIAASINNSAIRVRP